MLVVDLFSGLGGWSKPALDRGHEVFRVEMEPRFDAELHADILTLSPDDLPFRPDLLLASPPCEAFSVMRIGRNWNYDRTPKNDRARHGLALVEATIALISATQPRYFVIENPRGQLRMMPQMQGFERRTVTYCQYGEQRMKPTDLWSASWPPSLVLHEPCVPGSSCHVAAPRGSRTGTQGYAGDDYWVKSVVPYALALDVTMAAERDTAEERGGSIEWQMRAWND